MRNWQTAVVALAAMFVSGCERKGKEEKEELRGLAVKFLTAETYDEWSSCYEPESSEMLPKKGSWKKSPYGKEDIKITKIDVLGDAAIVYLEIETKPTRLWALKKKGKWFITFRKASRPLHKSSLQAAREHARKAQCKSNLMIISLHLARFQKKYERPPTSWEELVQEAPETKSLLRCPSAGEREVGYVLLAVAEPRPADAPFIAELPSNHGEGGHVLYAGRRVDWKDAEELQKILRAKNP